MKKILLVFLLLVVGVVAAAGIFLATFDADRFKPLIIEKASVALGAPVSVDKISLVWSEGVALRVTGFSVQDPERKETPLAVASADVRVRIAPLFQKRIEVSAIRVDHPKVELSKGTDGTVGLKGVRSPRSSAAGASPSGSSDAPSMDLFVRHLSIEQAEVRYEDRTASPPMDLTARSIDVQVNDFSLNSPFSVQAKAAVFSDRQNISLEARVSLPSGGRAGRSEELRVRTDLSALDLEAVTRALPAASAAGLRGPMKGVLTLTAKSLPLDVSALDRLSADLSVEGARVALTAVKSPIEDLRLQATVAGPDVTLKQLSAKFAGGALKASGMVKKYRTEALSGFSLDVKDLSIDELIPDQGAAGGPKLGGRLSVMLEGGCQGLDWPRISQSLNARGSVSLRDGVLLDYNLLREVLNKLSKIPGAEEVIQNRLPGIYRAKMNEPSTLLRPMELPVRIEGGQVYLDQMTLETDLLALRGSGQMGLDQTLALRAAVLLDRDLSSALSGLLPQIQLLTNAAGQIEIPVQVQGRLPRVMVLPDTEYITQKVVASKASELVTKLAENPEETFNQVKGLLKQPAAVPGQATEAGAGAMGKILGSKDGLQNLLNDLSGEPSSAPKES